MSDKLNILTSNIIRFVAGERPTADKFNAMNQYFSRSVENVCRAIGDMYGRSINDPLSPKWNPHSSEDGRSLDIATIGRLIGPASNLNPKMFKNSSSIIEEFDYNFIVNNGKEIQLKYIVEKLLIIPVIEVKVIKMDGGEQQLMLQVGNFDQNENSYRFYNDKTIGLHPNLTISEGEILVVSYGTATDDIEGGINYLNAGWNVIPDPNQNSKIKFLDGSLPQALNGDGVIALAEVSSGYDYVINLTDYKIESQQSGAVNLRDSEIQSLNDEYNQDKDFELPSWYENKFRTDENSGEIIALPEGLIYLKDLTSKEIYLTASYGYLSSKEIYIKDANLCEDHEFCLILTGTDITTSIDDLRNKMFNHRHDGSFGEPFIRIQDLVGKFVTSEFGPSSIPGNEFPMYLHRKGYQVDENVLNGNNAMLGDIFMGNILFDGIGMTNIEGENDTDSSHKIKFLNPNTFIQKVLGIFFINNTDDRYDGLTNKTIIKTGDTLQLSQKYLVSITEEDVTYTQKNITVNTELENSQNQNTLNLNSNKHNEEFVVKNKVVKRSSASNDELSSLNDEGSLFFLSKEYLKKSTENTDRVEGLINNFNSLNIGDGENTYSTRKVIKSNDLLEDRKHFRITFKPNKNIRYEIYPKPYYKDMALEEGFNDSENILKEYGTAFSAIDIEEVNAAGEYISVAKDIDVNYKKDESNDRRRISHYLPVIENSFEFNFKKAAIYDVELTDSLSYPNLKTIPDTDYGVWASSTGYSANPLATNDFTFWMLSNKERNLKRLIYFNSDLPIYAYYDLTNEPERAEKFFKDTVYDNTIRAINLHRSSHRNQYDYGIDDYEVQKMYLTDQPWNPVDDKYKNIHNTIEIGKLIRSAFLAKNTLGSDSLNPNISLNDAHLSFSLNVAYLPGWGDGDYDDRKGIGSRFYLKYLAKNFGIKVVFKDSLNELGEGANKYYHSWLIPGTDSELPLTDTRFKFSERYFFPEAEGDSPDGDGYVTFWNIMEVKADINRLFLKETDIDETNPTDSIFWDRIERGDLKMYLTWIPQNKDLIGNPTDTIAIGWEDLAWNDPNGLDESALANYSLGITYDGYHDKSRTITNASKSINRSETNYSLQDEAASNKISPMTKIYKSNHLGINCHYLFFPRILTNLDVGEKRSFSFNSIDTGLSLSRKSGTEENQFLTTKRDEGFYIAKYSYGWISYRVEGDTDDLSSYDEWSGWAEFPNIIFSYGNNENIIDYNDITETWYKLDGNRKNNEQNTVIKEGLTDNIRKEIKINGKSMYSGFVSHVDISELIKQYFCNHELRAWTVKNIGYYSGDGRAPFDDHTYIIRGSFMRNAEYGSILWQEPYKAIFGQSAITSDKIATSYHRNIGINFNLNIQEKMISSHDLLIEIDCLFSLELLSEVNAG
jgi:hypothetical protein